jgi:hypothetical protein
LVYDVVDGASVAGFVAWLVDLVKSAFGFGESLGASFSLGVLARVRHYEWFFGGYLNSFEPFLRNATISGSRSSFER